MRSVVIDAADLEEKQAAFFASQDAAVATGLLIGRMAAGAKDHIVRARPFTHPARVLHINAPRVPLTRAGARAPARSP